MQQERINRVCEEMKKDGVSQLLVTDPMAIFYLTDKWLVPGERMYGLYLNVEGGRCLIINELFPVHEDLGMDILSYKDTDDSMALLAERLLPGTLGVDKNMAAHFLLELMGKWKGQVVNGSLIVDRVRRCKDAEEIRRMRQVSLINDAVMEDLWGHVDEHTSEAELAKICEQLQIAHGCETVSFEAITAFGANCADPHHANDGTLGKPGDSVVLDIGGRKDSYCSDMTRTVFLGEASPKAREVYEIVKEANLRGIQAAKPGARFCDVDAAARDYITSKGYGPYFTHRTGHCIGLDCHEAGDVSGANEEVLKPGMCFSVEPGIYLPGEFGVRIEDLVLITEDGCEVLNHLSKDLKIIPLRG